MICFQTYGLPNVEFRTTNRTPVQSQPASVPVPNPWVENCHRFSLKVIGNVAGHSYGVFKRKNICGSVALLVITWFVPITIGGCATALQMLVERFEVDWSV